MRAFSVHGEVGAFSLKIQYKPPVYATPAARKRLVQRSALIHHAGAVQHKTFALEIQLFFAPSAKASSSVIVPFS